MSSRGESGATDSRCLTSFGDYEPLILRAPSLESLQHETYGRFLRNSVLEPGVRLVLLRHGRNPSWPYIDTKFNPNTGIDLPMSSYDVIYSWFLGRGAESLVLHLEALDSFELTEGEREEAERLFPQLIARTTETIMALTRLYRGRCPFRVNKDLRLASAEEPAPDATGAGDLFCARALLLSRNEEQRKTGAAMLERVASRIELGLFDLEGARVPAQGQSQCMHMLFQAVPRLLVGRSECEPYRENLFQRSCQFIQYVLDKHYDPITRRFSEFIDPRTGERSEVLDPGHCTEFVGLGLSAIYAMEKVGTGMTPQRKKLFFRAKKIMPEMLLAAVEVGFKTAQEGMVKAVNNRTGEVIDSTMPWWNLPETMRAALFAALIADNETIQRECLAIFGKCHNAYFGKYLNRKNMLFPHQTRCGRTGEVLDTAPSVPEGDPLYHSNLCFLDILKRLET